ncbi:hypothetical protein F2Q68_00023787 [Brassica cretica]|uniref:Uncharacterized protein n=1 Tax=Brassica cretica TaxID=69181 RepID=A0A8S9IH59_BRACR|nr:hypothetical protein F2Q68_00023787 [Brassica cretica]
MLPPKKVLGKCDDPEGVFCAQLRQETKFLLGFPLALQLWAFEAIPVLFDRLGGDDSVTLLSYVGDMLPTHTGLVLTDVLYAENNPKLTVLPMMRIEMMGGVFSTGGKYEALLGAVEGIKKELGRLNKVVEKQGRLLRKFKAKTIGKFSSSKLGGLRTFMTNGSRRDLALHRQFHSFTPSQPPTSQVVGMF